ncbi:tetratricopeptide repeat-containing sensor histidine kinase [Flavobacterium sp. 9AF]|uniref:tetratricopeptide repeat-containing sensor histidine kinase n=1 Tax=Flavobacterium sp. 9AF TaxID=2653142 RepID=UPI0013570983|nr:tetratricopeptide repeat-containing sensor histidine kinase [Flavobacterium sp. 9AF]
MKHFPFLFLILFLISCVDNEKDKEFSDSYTKGALFENKNMPDSAFFYFNKAKLSCKPNEGTRLVFIILKTAQLQEKLGDIAGSIETATESFQYFNKCDSISYIYSIYNCLGIDYEQLKKYDSSIEYYEKALKLSSDPLNQIIIKNNIGVISISLMEEKYETAINKFDEILNNPILKLNRKYYAKIIDNLGYAYFKLDKKDLAIKYLEESLEIRDSLGDDFEKTPSLIHLAQFYQKIDPKSTVNYAKKAYESARIVNNPDDKLEALDILVKNSLTVDELKYYYNQFYRIKDSVEFVRQTTKNQFADIKYDFRITKEESENQKKQKIIYLLLFILSVCIALAIFYIIHKKNKEREEKISYETETRISKRLHDELANDVFNTLTFIDTQDLQNPHNKETVLQDLDAIYDKTRNISKQTSEIRTGKEFSETLNQLFISYTSEQVNVIIQGLTVVDWGKIKENKQIEVYRILNELLVNMKKHSQANLVVIRFENLPKNIQIKYSDNGKGFEKDKVFKNGLQNVENRIHSIKGKINFDSETNKGVKINIEFPK